jgi:hypothetical protein
VADGINSKHRRSGRSARPLNGSVDPCGMRCRHALEALQLVLGVTDQRRVVTGNGLRRQLRDRIVGTAATLRGTSV